MNVDQQQHEQQHQPLIVHEQEHEHMHEQPGVLIAQPVHQQQENDVLENQQHNVVDVQQRFRQHFEPLAPLTQDRVPEQQRAAMMPMQSKSQCKEAYSHAKTLSQQGGLMTIGDANQIELLRLSEWGRKKWMTQKAKGGSGNYGEIYERVTAGDFSDFEHLDAPLRNALASRYMHDKFVPPEPGQTPEQYAATLRQEQGLEGMLHPLFRLGVSLCMRSGLRETNPGFFRQLDSALNTEIMVSTLTTTIDEHKNGIAGDLGVDSPEAVHECAQRNLASQIFIAKNLLMVHMSTFSKVTQKTNREPWNDNVANAFAHCSRVSFVLPHKSVQDGDASHTQMWKALREVDPAMCNDGLSENSAGLLKRDGSTHSFDRRRVNGQAMKEKKVLVNLFGQEGMNVAIGGLGQRGIRSLTRSAAIRNDGSCGHIYTMRKEATADENGGYLLGFESDAYKKTNQLGHKHGFGNGEYASSFGGQRLDEIGDKYGGREADLGSLTSEQITTRLRLLERYMRLSALSGADTDDVMRLLAGRKMDPAALNNFFELLNTRITNLEGGAHD